MSITKIIGIDITIKGREHSKALERLKAQAQGAFKNWFSADYVKAIEEATNFNLLINTLQFAVIHDISNEDAYIIGHQRNELNSQDMKNIRGFLDIISPYVKNKSKINLFQEGGYNLEPLDAVWYFEDKKIVFYEKENFRLKILTEKEKKAISRAIKAKPKTKEKVIKI